MTQESSKSQFKAQILRPKEPGTDELWGFVVLPKEASDKLPRRGRTTVDASINGKAFRVLLEPDGKKSHWMKVEENLLRQAGAEIGDTAQFEVAPVDKEPEPTLPADLLEALQASPEALATWEATTTIARVDWIHWVASAKQAKTRDKRIKNACEMLASGNKRVCCFDTSGFYSKALSAPPVAD